MNDLTPEEKMKFFQSDNIIQINELINEMKIKNIDWGIIIKLLTEMFYDLMLQVTSLYCVEISKFALFFMMKDVADICPIDIYDLIDDALILYQYPANFCPVSPESLYIKAKKISSNYMTRTTYRSKKDIILEMHNSNNILNIADIVKTSEKLVKKTIFLYENKKSELKKKSALEWYSLWP